MQQQTQLLGFSEHRHFKDMIGGKIISGHLSGSKTSNTGPQALHMLMLPLNPNQNLGLTVT